MGPGPGPARWRLGTGPRHVLATRAAPQADDDAPKKGKEKRSWDEGESRKTSSAKGKVNLDFSNKDEKATSARVFKPSSKLDLDAEFGATGDDEDEDDDGAELAAGAQGSGKPPRA